MSVALLTLMAHKAHIATIKSIHDAMTTGRCGIYHLAVLLMVHTARS